MTKGQKKSGFTLVELIVTIAITGIFLGMVTVFLGSSLNLFGGAKKESTLYADASKIVFTFDKFIDKVNKDGVDIIYSEGLLKTKDEKNSLSYSNLQIEAKIDGIIVSTDKVDKLSVEVVKRENEANIGLIIRDSNNKIIRTKVYYIIGGII